MNKRGVCGLAAACMLALLTGSVSAQTVRPLVPEDYKSLVAGKTFTASLNGYGWGEDITDNLQMTWRISERETYAAGTIESLQPGDELYAGNGRYTVGKIEQDEESLDRILGKYRDGLWGEPESFPLRVKLERWPNILKSRVAV